jgi:hypothetical protein
LTKIILELILFYLFYLFIFISSSGYGKILISFLSIQSKNVNYFELNLLGNILYLVIGYSLYLTSSINPIFNISLFFLGLGVYFFYQKNLNFISLKKIIFYLSLFFSALLISKLHEDFSTYHFPGLQEIFVNKLTLGSGNISLRLVHVSLLSYIQALYIFPFFEYKLINIPVLHIFISTVGYFFLNFKKLNTSKIEKFFCLFIFVFLIIKFTRLSEYGYDYIAQFLLLIIFHKLFFLKKNSCELFKSIILFVFSISIKKISILFSPLFLILFWSKNIIELIKSNHLKKYLSVVFLLSIIIFSNSFIRSGCIFYPINSTCLSKAQIDWGVKEKLKIHSVEIESWAKGFYHQKISKHKNIKNQKKYLSNWHWFKIWLDIHFFYKVSEFILIIISLYFFIYFVISKNKKMIMLKSKELLSILGLSLTSIFFWLDTVPQFRFGFTSIIIFFFFSLVFIFQKDFELKKRSTLVMIIISIIFFNLKNFSRINSELTRNDLYKYNNFPWFNSNFTQQSFKGDNLIIKDKKFYRIVKGIN